MHLTKSNHVRQQQVVVLPVHHFLNLDTSPELQKWYNQLFASSSWFYSLVPDSTTSSYSSHLKLQHTLFENH